MSCEIRLVLLGKTGAGKSCTGNTILGKKHFKSSVQASIVTKSCQSQYATVQGRQVTVVDTPGLFDIYRDQKESLDEIRRIFLCSSPGPHAFLVVFRIGRSMREDFNTINDFLKLFGDYLCRYAVIVCTRYDDYKRDMGLASVSDCSMRDYILTLPGYVQDFVANKCGSRVVGFDNTLKGKESVKQVQNLFSKIDKMLASNGESFYTIEDYRQAEAQQQSEMEEEESFLNKMLEGETRKKNKEIKEAADKIFKESIRLETAKISLPRGKKRKSKSSAWSLVRKVAADVALNMPGEMTNLWKRVKKICIYY